MINYYHKHIDTTQDNSMKEIHDLYKYISYQGDYKITLNIDSNNAWEIVTKWVIYYFNKSLIYEKIKTAPTQIFWGIYGRSTELKPTKLLLNGEEITINYFVSNILNDGILPIGDQYVEIYPYDMPYCIQFVSHNVSSKYRSY